MEQAGATRKVEGEVRRTGGTAEKRWGRQAAVMYCENVQWRRGKRRGSGGRSGEEVLMKMAGEGRSYASQVQIARLKTPRCHEGSGDGGVVVKNGGDGVTDDGGMVEEGRDGVEGFDGGETVSPARMNKLCEAAAGVTGPRR